MSRDEASDKCMMHLDGAFFVGENQIKPRSYCVTRFLFLQSSEAEMKNRNILIIAGVALSAAFFFGFFKSSNPVKLYGEFCSDIPTKAKYVEITPITITDFNYKDFTIDALGYKEVRVFVNLFDDQYKTQPLTGTSTLKLCFSHEMSGMGTPYKQYTFKQEFGSYLCGFVTESVYGKTLKIAVDADNIPKGNYTLHLSYYLLP
jgi:hypothetical protein